MLPLADKVPIQPSVVEPPDAVQAAPGEATHVNVTGTPAVTLDALANIDRLACPTPPKLVTNDAVPEGVTINAPASVSGPDGTNPT
jgi:hypothetical protein